MDHPRLLIVPRHLSYFSGKMSKISQNVKSSLQKDPASSAAIAIESRTISQRKTISQDAIPAQTYVPRLGALPSYCENAGAGASNRFLNRNSVGDSYPASSPSVRVDSERLSGRARLRIRSNLKPGLGYSTRICFGSQFPQTIRKPHACNPLC